MWFVKAYPRETTEAFLDGHVSAFAFLGGIRRSILYDNTTLAVARILGDGTRQRTRAFTLQSSACDEPRSTPASRPTRRMRAFVVRASPECRDARRFGPVMRTVAECPAASPYS